MSNSYFDMSALSPETVTKVLHMDDDSIGRVSDTGEDTYKGPVRQTTSDQSFLVTFTCCVDAAMKHMKKNHCCRSRISNVPRYIGQ